MRPALLYRIAAVLLVLFAIAHTLGFRQTDPSWKADAVVGAMHSTHFDVSGADRTYWDLFCAAGFTVGAFYAFAGLLAWQLGGLPPATLAAMRPTTWLFAACFAVITVICWKYLFILPVIFAGVATVCLVAAAWWSAQPPVTSSRSQPV